LFALTLRQALSVSLLILVRSDRKFKYRGPVKGDEISPDLMSRIVDLRRRIQAKEAPYLQSPAQLEIEKSLRLDERSFHFYSLDEEGELVGALRLTPAPFELSALSPELATAAGRYAGFFEISRYVVEKNAKMAERLLLFSGAWLLRKTTAPGVIALCPEKLKEYYRYKYGILTENISEAFPISTRKSGAYFIVKAEFSKFFRHIMERIVRLRQR